MAIYSFPPLTHPEATVLLLGTMPGVQSLERQQYYGNPRNHFWRILFTISNTALPTDYQAKQRLLLQNNIALWDVLQACERQGSLDSAIQEEVPNDFEHFLAAHPKLTHIGFNGQQAAKYFKKYVSVDKRYTLATLPSTSPAHAGMSFEAKLAVWRSFLMR